MRRGVVPAAPVPGTSAVLRSNKSLRDGLRVWDALLRQVRTGSYAECLHAISVLRNLCRSLEDENRRRVREKEKQLYGPIEKILPEVRDLVGEMRKEHHAIREVLRDFQQELAQFNSTGNSQALLLTGEELARTLRHQMDREERQLLPAILRKLPARSNSKGDSNTGVPDRVERTG